MAKVTLDTDKLKEQCRVYEELIDAVKDAYECETGEEMDHEDACDTALIAMITKTYKT